jgi:molybdate-binding protein
MHCLLNVSQSESMIALEAMLIFLIKRKSPIMWRSNYKAIAFLQSLVLFEIVIVINRQRSSVTAISLGEQFTFDEMVISGLY